MKDFATHPLLRALLSALLLVCWGGMRAEASPHGAMGTRAGLQSGDPGESRLKRVADDGQVAGTWDGRWGPPGPNGPVLAIATMGSDLYVGGQFTQIGNVAANNIARWDGHAWHALGDGAGNGVSLMVRSLLVDGDSLFVGGQFDAAGGMAVNNLAVWHPAERRWSPLGDGVTGDAPVVAAMLKHGDDLYVAGRFTATTHILVNNIARWNGKGWGRLSAGILGVVATLAINGNSLYVGGVFSSAGDIPVRNLACWDMALQRWSDVGGGVDSIVSSIAVHGNDIYVGGHFYKAGAIPATELAIWNEASRAWRPFPWTFENHPNNIAHINALLIDGSDLYIAGVFNMGPSGLWGYNDTVQSIIRWKLDQGSMERLGESLVEYDTKYPYVEALHLAGGMLYVVGGFPLAGYYEASNIAALRIADDAWLSFGSSVNGMKSRFFFEGRLLYRDRDGLRAMALDGEHIYVAGYFTSAGGVATRNVARWDGNAWNALAQGLGRAPSGPMEFRDPEYVDAIALRGGELFAGGVFSLSGSDSVRNVARWDGTRWWPMGALSGDGFDTVTALVVAGGDLYAAGAYRVGDSVSTAIARWSGSDWVLVHWGFDASILAMAADGNALYLGGSFTRVGDLICNGVARLDLATQTWSALGNGVTFNGAGSPVRAILIDRGKLYVGGDFREAGSLLSPRIALWDGVSWSPIGTGIGLGSEMVGGSVRAIAMVGNDLYIGGDFTPTNGFIGANLMMWDGESWREVDQGLDDRVNGLAAKGGSLLVCGDFHAAGETYAHYLTVWTKSTGTAEVAMGEALPGPSAATLAGVMPNPASGSVSIAVYLPHSCSGTLLLYDALGRPVATILDGALGAGYRVISWNTARIADGNYFLRLATSEGVSMARVTVAH